ncbi:hypothetical protein [Aestuariibius sp. HNIBRBA575]|uniref:hypothetical protein n=1 Tax=Aestuariibius sp. HNIBRBA575 TaxID=3233343 RepID=UPI0034A4B539
MERIFAQTGGAAGPRWGLRGDPLLWDALKDHFTTHPDPSDISDFKARLHQLINDIIGMNLQTAPAHIPVPAFYRENGGMSSGMVARDTWLLELVPLLEERFKDLHNPLT